MARKTKKVKMAGRFGPRFGSTLRKRVRIIEQKSKSKFRCPLCKSRTVKRKAVGIWNCSKCSAVITGGAWILETSEGKRSQISL